MRDVTRPELESAARRLCADLKIDPDLKIDSDIAVGCGRFKAYDVLADLLSDWYGKVRAEEHAAAFGDKHARRD